MLPPCRIMMKHRKSAIMKLNWGLKFWFLNGKGGCLGEILHLPTWQGSHPSFPHLTSSILSSVTWPKRRMVEFKFKALFHASHALKPWGLPLRGQGLTHSTQVTSTSLWVSHASPSLWLRVLGGLQVEVGCWKVDGNQWNCFGLNSHAFT